MSNTAAKPALIIVIGGFMNSQKVVDEFVAVVASKSTLEVIGYSLDKAIRHKQVIAKQAKQALIITHSADIALLQEEGIVPLALVANSPPVNINRRTFAARYLKREAAAMAGSKAGDRGMGTLTARQLELGLKHCANFDLQKYSARPQSFVLVASENDELYRASDYKGVSGESKIIDLNHDGIFTRPQDFLRQADLSL